ncbi:MAG: hypothetical protein LZF60_20163 [Nitrospira sp.]|nr:MAG: hypothetical protein LZF60_20163 [Nitrospira sp.]
MAQDIERVRQIKTAAEDDLLSRPGVTGVDVGYKFVNGQKTDEIVIRIHVADKKEVPPDQKIPDTIQGVKTDVIQKQFRPAGDRGYYNPILGGIDIGPLRAVDLESIAGTLGAIVVDNDTQDRMLLSNYHVLCVNEGWDQWGDVGRRITQPSFGGILVATIRRGILNKDADAAVARLDNSTRYTCGIQDIGAITGTAAPELGMAVRKRGRSTGLTYGTIHGLDSTAKITFGHGVGTIIFRNQIEVYPDTTRNAQFADQGDSGSVIVNDAGQAVALLFAIDADSNGTGTATPIHTILEKLNVRMAIEGIGGFDLSSAEDRAFAFDYTGTGKLNHLVFYRPGTGIMFILKKEGAGGFTPVYESHSGIGTYDLSVSDDQACAFDYDSVGAANHLVLYRPGTGAVFILKKDGVGTYFPIFKDTPGGSGIGGYDLSSPDDRAFAFDYAGTGKLDHLVFYRPGKGIVFILKKDSPGTFSPAYQSHSGIGGYDLLSSDDRAFAFDYTGTGRLDHLVFYRPGKKIIFVLKKDGTGGFTPVYHSQSGIGGFDLSDLNDHMFAFDYDGIGTANHLVLYRPGTGAIFIIKKDGTGNYYPVYQQNPGGSGIGGYDLSSSDDRAFAFDYAGTGKLDHLVFYRPGKGIVFILRKDGPGKFSPVYQATQ